MIPLVVILFVLLPSPAFAYFDAGTGSILIQALVGVVAGIAVFWGRIKVKFSQWFGGTKIDGVQDDAEQ